MTLPAALAEFGSRQTAPPQPVANIAITAIADGFSAILAGAESEVALRVLKAVGPIADGNAPLFGGKVRLSAPYAALINAVAGHSFDLDDWEEPGNTHPTVVLLPALLAAAHVQPKSGAELLSAYAVGCEIIMRLGELVSMDHYARGFHSTATLGTLGAAGACAKLLGLDKQQMIHALAIATSQAIGYTAQFGTHAKPLQAGFAARAGLEAALLARAGVTGQPATLFDPRGFSGLLGDHDAERLTAVVNALGRPWALEQYGLVLKPWPSCGYTHRIMTAALELRPKLQARLGQIAQIEAVLPDFHLAILPFHMPRDRNEALFSLPACLAQALVKGSLTLADGQERFWLDNRVVQLIDRTRVSSEPARNPLLNYDPEQPDRLTVKMQNGEVLETVCAYPLGAPQNPMGSHELGVKFNSITGRPAEQFVALLKWAETDNVTEFFEGFS